MNVGDRVHFGRQNGEKTLGEVVQVNRVTAKVRQLESRGTMKSHPVGTVWKVPLRLCVPVGQVMAPEAVARLKAGQDRDFEFLRGGSPARSRPEAEVMADILGVYGELSPENLTCDGELSAAQVRRRSAELHRRLQLLFKEIGRTVSETEAYRGVRVVPEGSVAFSSAGEEAARPDPPPPSSRSPGRTASSPALAKAPDRTAYRPLPGAPRYAVRSWLRPCRRTRRRVS